MSVVQIGDVVVLKSGGPRMTVVGAADTARTCGFFSYNVYSTMTADVAAFAFSGSEDPEVDTLVTQAIPRLVTASLEDQTEEYQVGSYTITQSPEGDRTLTLQALVPNNSTLDLTEASFLIHVDFAGYDEEDAVDVAGAYVSIGPLRYYAGMLVRFVSIAFPEPTISPS